MRNSFAHSQFIPALLAGSQAQWSTPAFRGDDGKTVSLLMTRTVVRARRRRFLSAV